MNFGPSNFLTINNYNVLNRFHIHNKSNNNALSIVKAR